MGVSLATTARTARSGVQRRLARLQRRLVRLQRRLARLQRRLVGSYGSGGGYYTASYTAAPIATAVTAVAYLNVKVPEDAKVYLQDQLMTLPGTQRRFVTPAIGRGIRATTT